MDCYLVLRGIKTLAVRMDRHCVNAASGGRLAAPPPGRCADVLYPGLPTHPGHDLAARQMRGFGGMVSFVQAGGRGGGAGDGALDPVLHAGRVARGGGVA